jgi:hypothetical protein
MLQALPPAAVHACACSQSCLSAADGVVTTSVLAAGGAAARHEHRLLVQRCSSSSRAALQHHLAHGLYSSSLALLRLCCSGAVRAYILWRC